MPFGDIAALIAYAPIGSALCGLHVSHGLALAASMVRLQPDYRSITGQCVGERSTVTEGA
jgi:hypothetical protein